MTLPSLNQNIWRPNVETLDPVTQTGAGTKTASAITRRSNVLNVDPVVRPQQALRLPVPWYSH